MNYVYLNDFYALFCTHTYTHTHERASIPTIGFRGLVIRVKRLVSKELGKYSDAMKSFENLFDMCL